MLMLNVKRKIQERKKGTTRREEAQVWHFYGSHFLTCPLGPGSPDKPCHSKHRDFVIFTFITSIYHFMLQRHSMSNHSKRNLVNECLKLLLQRANVHHCFTVM